MAISFDQFNFRFRDDSTALNTDGGWLAARNVNVTRGTGTGNLFRIRIMVDTNNQDGTTTFKLKYDKNGAASYADVTTSSSNIRITGGTPTDGSACSTQLLTGNDPASGSFENDGSYDDGDGTLSSWTNGKDNFAEFELCCYIVDADVANNDTIDLRLYESGDSAFTTYTVTPRVTVSKAGVGGGEVLFYPPTRRKESPIWRPGQTTFPWEPSTGQEDEAWHLELALRPWERRRERTRRPPPIPLVVEPSIGQDDPPWWSRFWKGRTPEATRPTGVVTPLHEDAAAAGEVKFETGTWTADGTASQTITLADGSFGTPIAIIVWTQGQGAVGAGFQSNSILSVGFGTRRGGSTQEFCASVWCEDNVATSSASRRRHAALAHVYSAETTTDYTVGLSSFGSAQFTVSYSSAGNASGDVFCYRVFGGVGLTDANVLEWTMDSTASTEVITGVGFQPSVLIAADMAASTTGSGNTHTQMGFGCASSSSDFWCVSMTASDGDTATSTMNWNRAFRTDACLERLGANDDVSDARWDLDSFDSDGVTLGVLDAPPLTTQEAIFLFIEGGTWEAGTFTSPSSTTGDQTVTLSDSSLTPVGLITANDGHTGVGLVTSQYRLAVGAGSTPSPTQGSAVNNIVGITAIERINTAADRYRATDAIASYIWTDGGGGTNVGEEAWLDAWAAGEFTIDWATSNGSQLLYGYLAIGGGAAPEADVGPWWIRAARRFASGVRRTVSPFLDLSDVAAAPEDGGETMDTPRLARVSERSHAKPVSLAVDPSGGQEDETWQSPRALRRHAETSKAKPVPYPIEPSLGQDDPSWEGQPAKRKQYDKTSHVRPVPLVIVPSTGQEDEAWSLRLAYDPARRQPQKSHAKPSALGGSDFVPPIEAGGEEIAQRREPYRPLERSRVRPVDLVVEPSGGQEDEAWFLALALDPARRLPVTRRPQPTALGGAAFIDDDEAWLVAVKAQRRDPVRRPTGVNVPDDAAGQEDPLWGHMAIPRRQVVQLARKGIVSLLHEDPAPVADDGGEELQPGIIPGRRFRVRFRRSEAGRMDLVWVELSNELEQIFDTSIPLDPTIYTATIPDETKETVIPLLTTRKFTKIRGGS